VNESEDDFIRRVGQSANQEEEMEEDETTDIPGRPRINHRRWALGPTLRGKGGSLIQDIWKGPAADLMTMNQIAVYPKKGWWSYRSFDRESPWYLCKQRPIRYSLIVSIETMADIPLYTEISNLVSVPVTT
jgi:hypothetical protein